MLNIFTGFLDPIGDNNQSMIEKKRIFLWKTIIESFVYILSVTLPMLEIRDIGL